MAYTVAFDVRPADDPLGSVLVRLTPGDQLTDAGFTVVLHGTGEGFIEIHADDPDVQYLERRALVQCIRTDTDPEQPLFAFFLEQGDFKPLSKREQEGRVLRFGGPGGLFILDRYVLGYDFYAPGQGWRGDTNVPDKWTWFDESPGAILTRMVEEGQNAPGVGAGPSPYAPVTINFSRTLDSNGVPWSEFTDYQTKIGTSGLKLVSDLIRLGLIVQCSPDLEISAYRDLGEFRQDRSTATFTAGNVRFAAGQNIVNELNRRVAASQERTHVTIRGKSGGYVTVDTGGSGVPYYAYLDSENTDDAAALEAMGELHLTRRQEQSDQAVIQHLLGPGGTSGADGYSPGPEGDYWVGDLVTIHTGTTEHDFNEQIIEVASIRWYLRGADWMVEAHLGAQYIDAQVEGFREQLTTTIRNIGGVALCQPTTFVEVEGIAAQRLYFTAHEVGGASNPSGGESAPSPAMSAQWDQDEALSDRHMMNTTYQNAWSSTIWSDTDNPAPRDVFMGQFLYPLSTGNLLNIIKAGGGVVRAQLRARARYGVGISEASQDMVAQIGVRVVTSSGAVRGTALGLEALASSAGSTKFPAQATLVNRVFPAAAAGNVLEPVPNAVNGDYLVVEVGCRFFGPTTGGTGAALEAGGASPLGENETDTSGQGWVEFELPGSTTVLPGSGMVELVGTSTSAKRCDDTETYHAAGSAGPTVNDDVDAGFRLHTRWVNDDDDEWICLDTTAGAADWLQIGSGSSAGGAMPRCFAYRGSAVSLSQGTVTAIPLTSERVDTDGFHDNATNPSRITIPTGLGGLYEISGHIQIAGSTNDSTELVLLRLNGTTYIGRQGGQAERYNTGAADLSVSTTYELAQGDYIELCAYQDAGAGVSRNVNSVGNYSPELRVVRLSD